MRELLLHPETKQAIDRFVTRPSHALLITAPAGSGKTTLAQYVAAQLIGVVPEKLSTYPYFKYITSEPGKTISIEAIRQAIGFTTLRTTKQDPGISRIIVIDGAQAMTTQAQNALLKTIEEPPTGTVLLLTATSERSVLPTIRSRVQHLALLAPSLDAVTAYFQKDGYDAAAIKKAMLMSGGLVGLMHALLAAEADHPLLQATATARDILQKTPFERVILTESLAKQKQLWIDTLFILTQMAHAALQQPSVSEASARRWHKILTAVHQAQTDTMSNGQLKLILLHFMLSL